MLFLIKIPHINNKKHDGKINQKRIKFLSSAVNYKTIKFQDNRKFFAEAVQRLR